jgi:hypothetical protein
MNDKDINVPVTMPWEISCRIACLAFLNRCSFNDMVLKMIKR